MNAERSAAWVRRWVGLYTLGLRPEIKQRRRDEIDDDLWCQAQDAAESRRADRSLGGEILTRLAFGVPADLSWRMEQARLAARQRQPRRVINMNAPGRALLAAIGGIGWTVWPIPQAIVGVTWPAGDPLSAVLFVSVIGGSLALAGAMGGFVALASDRMRTWVAVAVSLGAVIGIFGVLAVSPAVVLIPVGSAVLMWELRRIGFLDARLALAHIAAAVVVVAVMVVIFNSTVLLDRATAVPVLALAIPYGLTWIAIGSSLYRSSIAASPPASA